MIWEKITLFFYIIPLQIKLEKKGKKKSKQISDAKEIKPKTRIEHKLPTTDQTKRIR